MPRAQLLTGDALTVLRTLPSGLVRCCITSPPYWGLRDYGTAQWEGGDTACDHKSPPKGGPHTASTLGPNRDGLGPNNAAWAESKREHQYTHECGKCGARRIDAQLGLERTPEEYVARLVEVFREVRRVLADDGTVFLNLGDSYASQGGSGRQGANGQRADRRFTLERDGGTAPPPGLKPKDLAGIPWSVAFALRQDGWYLRSEIIWAKPNPMPESVTDRPTKAHEQVFLLSKRASYFYDAAAIMEDFADDRMGNPGGGTRSYAIGDRNDATDSRMLTWSRGAERGGRNARTVWEIATQPYAGAHFATFPEELARRCILAGTSQRGHCPECGKPWERMVERPTGGPTFKPLAIEEAGVLPDGPGTHRNMGARYQKWLNENPAITTGWAPTCDHNLEPAPDVVLDPFSGSGTVASVAVGNGRAAIGIELNPKYQELALHRIGPLLAEVA